MKKLLPFLILFCTFGIADAATYYMRADGTNADSDCSGSSACCVGAMDMSDHNAGSFSAGDTIYVCDDGGVLRGQMTIPSSGADGSPITYAAASGDTPAISGLVIVNTWSDVGDDDYDRGADDSSNTTADRNYRVPIANGVIDSGRQIRVTLAGGSVDAIYKEIYIGEKAASGDVYDMESGTITEVLFGGTSGVTVAAAGTEVSDWLTYDFDSSKDYIISVGFTSGSVGARSSSWNGTYYGSDEDLAGTANVSGFSNTAGVYTVRELETRSPNVWSAGSTSSNPNITYFDGTRGTQAASYVAMDADQEWYYCDGCADATDNTLYQYVGNDEDPDTKYTSPGTEFGGTWNALVTNDQTWITFDGLIIRGGSGSHTVNVGTGTINGVVFQNCTIDRGLENGLNVNATVSFGTLTIDNCIIEGHGHHGIYFDTNEYATTAIISNSTITANGWASLEDSSYYSGIEGQLGNVNIYGNTIYQNSEGPSYDVDTNHGIYGGASVNVANIYENKVYGHDNGAGIKMLGSANIYRNIVYENDAYGILLGQNTTNDVVYVVYNNVIYGNNLHDGPSSGITEQNMGSGTLDMTIYNNTLYNNGSASSQEIQLYDDVTSAIIKNNILFASATRRSFAAVSQSALTMDYNIHWRADGDPNIYYNGATRTWATWQGYGFDTNGVNSNPLLTNPGSNDFTLGSGSPAIGAGADLGATYDDALDPASSWPASVSTVDQDLYGAAWEIGAYANMGFIEGGILTGSTIVEGVTSFDTLDGTMTLACTTANDQALYQELTSASFYALTLAGAGVAGSWNPGATVTITGYFWWVRDDDQGGSIVAELQTQAGGVPSGTPVAGTSVTLGHASIDDVSMAKTWFELSSPTEVTAASMWVVIKDDENGFDWTIDRSDSDVHAGSYAYDSGGGWGGSAIRDVKVEIWGCP